MQRDNYGVYPLQPVSERLAGVYPQTTGVREGWQVVFVTSELPRALYRAYLSGRTDEAICMNWFGAWGMDTASVAGPDAHLFLAFALG